MGDIYNDILENDNSVVKETSQKDLILLNTYGTNLTELAQNGLLDPVIGREDEIKRTIQILGRRKKNNPILIGYPGTGKSSIVEGLAQKIVNNDVPNILLNKQIFIIEPSRLVAGTKFRGQFEERIQGLLTELKNNDNILIFIDELHTIVGAGDVGGGLDISNIIKPALANGDINCIGATTYDEYRKYIETDGALNRRFQPVTINPTTVTETINILKKIKYNYESFHLVKYNDEILELIVKLSDVYIKDRYFPDKAIDILDEVGSYKKIENVEIPLSIKKLNELLKTCITDKQIAVKEQDYELAAEKRDKCIQISNKIEKEKTKWLSQLKKNLLDITDDDIYKIISKITNVPLEKININNDNIHLSNIEKNLKKIVIGQDEVIDKIAKTIRRSRIGLRKKNHTIGNFIFLGKSGVGKTFLATQLSKYLFNDDNLIRIDMSEYMEKHSVSKLVGSPPGYVGYNDGGYLTELVRQKPYSIILFDEIEKAHPDVFNIFLQILDDGYITDSAGVHIDFTHCLIIMTSNLGTSNVQYNPISINKFNVNESSNKEDIIYKALKSKFKPEFLNRIDDIVIFNELSKENLYKILDNNLKELSDNLYDLNKSIIKITKKAKDILIEKGYHIDYGARELKRIIEKLIENPITDMIFNNEIKDNDIINIKAVNNELKIENETLNK